MRAVRHVPNNDDVYGKGDDGDDDDGDDDVGGDLENWVNIFVYNSDNNIYFSAEGKRGKSFTGGKHLTQIGEAEKYETTTFQ